MHEQQEDCDTHLCTRLSFSHMSFFFVSPPPPPSAEAAAAVAAAPPEPEEPFDNSTYKNNQHHNYNAYTFADLDLEMSKYRLPQPSSGRPSPRH